MALRSQEEVSLATVFARTLRSVIALTAAEDRRVYPDAGEILRGSRAEETAPAALVRLLQFTILPEILGESAGPAIYLAAKRATRDLGIRSIQGLKDWFAQMGLGDLEVELDEERVLVKLNRCLSCERLAATGTPVCDVERGIIDGVLEDITGTEVLTKETMCWSLGDTVCQFEGYSGKQAGYLYKENGFHPVEQRRLLTQLADQADIALDNLRLLHERREHETHDPLTGLLNFRALRDRAAYELARAERHGRNVAFVMLDLDGFTAVNETAGREAGDEVLRHWAAALTAQLRNCDLVCRYGADEFLLVMPETADPEADTALARVLGAMRQLAVETGDQPIALTASAGVASFPADGRSAEELVAKAATTMYTARASGPGHIAFYSGPPRS
jgi:diguanylate cyclase (GGDEF)-like protein